MYGYNCNYNIAVTDTSAKCNTVAHSNICSTKCNTIVVMVLLLWFYPGNSTKCYDMAVVVLNVVLFLLWFFILAFVPWLPHAFPGSLFTNPLWVHVAFERSTNGGWHNPSGTFSDGWGDSLEQVAWVLETQRQEKLSVNI